MPRIDQTILNLIALTIAAGGAFTVLTKYNANAQLRIARKKGAGARVCDRSRNSAAS